MTVKTRKPEETYGPALKLAREWLARSDPVRIGVLARVSFLHTGPAACIFSFPFLQAEYEVLWPAGDVRLGTVHTIADVTTQLILLHYLVTADGTPMADQWLAFRRLPGGMGYDAAFQGRANRRLAQHFGSNKPAFEAAALALGGERLAFGDASFSFRVLPSVWLAAVLNLADDELPAEASVLFDGSANHYLPTEDLAVLGGLLSGRIIKASRAP